MQAPWLRLIGPPAWVNPSGELRFAAERPFQLMTLLAYRGDWEPRERLAGLFWPGHAADAARRNLRKVLFRLRELPGLPLPEESAGALRWQVETDLRRLDDALARGDTAAVAAAWQRQPFDGLDGDSGFADWLLFERQRLRTRWRQALLSGIDAQPDPAQALAWARLLRTHDPLDEEALRAELQALLNAGLTADARQVYAAFEADLARELATRPEARTRAWAARLPSSVDAGPAPGRPGAPLVGREHERRLIAQRLTQPGLRWLTLLGPGGIGKTRLAQAVAEAAAAGTAAVVQGQDLLQADALPPRIAQALSLGAAAFDEAVLLHALQGRTLLLVLDNLEQVEGLPQLAERLLGAVPGLQVLATSRRRLGVAGEVVLELAGLPYPDAEDSAEAERFDAVRLFLQAVERHRGDFDLEHERDAVVALCRAVEGWPLALELCAAWTPQLGVSEIVSDLLRGGAAVLQAPAAEEGRHDSLLRILQVSWQRLGLHEQTAVARLAQLEEPCSAETARAVSGASLSLLVALADRAWLRLERQPGAAGRWSLHALVRRFLCARLGERPDWAAAATEALCNDQAQRAARVPPAHQLAAHAAALESLAPDLPALVQAWRCSVAAARAERLDVLQMPLARLLLERQAWQQGVALFEAALPLLQGQPRARALGHLSLLRLHGGQQSQAVEEARLALRSLRRGSDEAALLHAHVTLGQGLLRSGQWDAAWRVLNQGRERARRLGDVQTESQLLDLASGVPYARGRHDEQAALLEQGIALAVAHGLKPVISYSNLGNARRSMGRLDEAEAAFRRGLALAVGPRWRRERATLLLNLGLMLGDRNRPGDRDQAMALAHEGLQAAGGGVDVRIELYLLGLLASAQSQAGDLPAAALALRRALGGARRLNLPQAQLWLVLEWAQWLSLAGRLDEALGALGTVLAHPAVPAGDTARARVMRAEWGLDPDRPDPREAGHRSGSVEALVDHVLATG